MATLSRRSRRASEIWPGFVDALATLLMVIIFLLMIFVLAQFLLTEAISGRDAALVRLQSQIDELADLLALERGANVDLRLDLAQLSGELQASVATRDEMTTRVESLSLSLSESEARSTALSRELDDAFETMISDRARIEAQASELTTLSNQIAALRALKQSLEEDVAASRAEVARSTSALSDEREISETARAQVALLNQKMAALRAQLRQLASLLEASESVAEQQKVQISSLGQRLNAALASRVQELARYRSEFFGRLREVLGDRPGVRIVGDRFVFQSEVLFATGSAEIGPEGRGQVEQFAATLREVAERIPPEIDWILRVDGHTDVIPIRTAQYPSNW